MRISDWSSDVCSSDLVAVPEGTIVAPGELLVETTQPALETDVAKLDWRRRELQAAADSELGGDMVKRRISPLEIDAADHRLPIKRTSAARSVGKECGSPGTSRW